MENEAKWFRVAGFGHGGGATHKTPSDAWRSALRGYDESERGTACAAHSFMLYAATTRRAADNACVSVVRDTVGRGAFWRMGPEESRLYDDD